jgi:lysozyme
MALALVAASACSSDEPRVGERIGESELEAVVCAPGEQLDGIDVSYYQGQPNWPAVAQDGVRFAITRVNHGDFMDPEFDTNWAAIKEVGMLRGAYQYFDPGGDPVAQAQTLIDRVGVLEPGDLPPVIDVESTDGLGADAIAANVRTWVDLVEGALGRRPFIYTGSYFWNDNVVTDEFSDHPLWIAHYTTGCPNLPTVWNNWAMWQYSSTGSVAGISGNVDLNFFNGSMADLHDLAGDGYRGRVVSLEYPEALDLGASGTVTLVIENLGARGWGAGTKLGTSMPRDRESLFAADDWESATRIGPLPQDVPSGETLTVEFTVTAPAEEGDYVEHFNLVEEDVAWFSDTPPGGGPSDDAIALHIEVRRGAGSSSSGYGSGGPSSGSGVDGGIPASGEGCSVAAPGRASLGGWLVALALAALTRGRRTTRPRRRR